MQTLRLLAISVCLTIIHTNVIAQKPTKEDKNHELDEVVVVGYGKKTSINTVSNSISKQDITLSMGKTLSSMLEQIGGVSSIQTGLTVAKPVIHGMYGNRILIINNGARLTGQQWGTDHAPEIDKNSAQTIEVVKGAEGIRYGSEALGGIILIDQKALPYRNNKIHGNMATMYGTNGKRYAINGMAEGSIMNLPNMAWRIQATYGNSGDRKTANYILNNTGNREFNLSASMGYKWRSYRIEGSYSLFRQKIGVMQSAQMGNEDLLRERILIGQPVYFTPYTRTIGYPHQKITHHTAMMKLFYTSELLGNFSWQTSYQKDDRRENRIRRMNNSDIPTVSLRLQSLQNMLKWEKKYEEWTTEAGMQLINTENHSERGTGSVPIIPNYTETIFGLYALEKISKEKWGAETGARFDYQNTKADGFDWTGEQYGGKHHFTNFTYSLGGHLNLIRNLRLTTNFGMAWRAPHVYELYSNGNELSSGTYVMGKSDLKSEHSYKWITSAQYSRNAIRIRIDAYMQWINNYIYDEPAKKNIVVVAGAFPLFQYKQTSAFFRGFDLDVHILPCTTLDYHFVASKIWANERKTNNYLPYIPSARFTQSITWKPKTTHMLKPTLSINHRFVARQKRFDPSTDLISFAPNSYNLFGIEGGVNWETSSGQSFCLMITGDNLFNKEYKEYTNRSRYYAHDAGRDIRCTVAWNF